MLLTLNLTAAHLHSSKPSLGQIQEDQKPECKHSLPSTSIFILHRQSLPRFKGIDGF